MTPPSIQARRNRAEAALDVYCKLVGTTAYDEALIDLLTDLLHWSDGAGVDFQYAIDHAGFHFNAEVQS
jgi:hypothetical protein